MVPQVSEMSQIKSHKGLFNEENLNSSGYVRGDFTSLGKYGKLIWNLKQEQHKGFVKTFLITKKKKTPLKLKIFT